jgi:hypothetical protein
MKAADYFIDLIKKYPERFLQPWVKQDPMMGNRWFVNPDYVNLYENPYNEINKKNIIIEKDQEYKIVGHSQKQGEEIDKERNKKRAYKMFDKVADSIRASQHSDNRFQTDKNQCQRCSAHNPPTRLSCWVCLNEL